MSDLFGAIIVMLVVNLKGMKHSTKCQQIFAHIHDIDCCGGVIRYHFYERGHVPYQIEGMKLKTICKLLFDFAQPIGPLVVGKGYI